MKIPQQSKSHKKKAEHTKQTKKTDVDPDADIFGEFPKGHPLAISINDIKSWPQYDFEE